ncbi:hypothetical protein AXA44_34490 [Rhodococcus sp. SC4]|nr:hypothetical protein AXA44_34490 [Rhodococcus sp. SC4]
MATLLHIDSSIRTDVEGSVSRGITAAFAERWQKVNPDSRVIYRDLGRNPVPHQTWAAYSASLSPAEAQTDEQKAAAAVSQELAGELLAADVVVLGVPMYNYSVPDNFKTWIDRIATPALFANPETGEGVLSGTRFVVVHSRGGSYAPGTPREDFDFQETYLKKLLSTFGVTNTEFVRAELTMAKAVPAMADLIPLGEKSLTDAHSSVLELASV